MTGPAVFIRKRSKFATRLQGYAMSRHVWTCRKCRAWHEHKKPKRCDQCQHPEFLHYDSAGEARWFVGLMRGLDAGTLHDLVHHPRYPIHVCQVDVRAHIKVFDYVADAEYEILPLGNRKRELVTGDFKPKAAAGLDPVFELKRKCFEAQYGRPVTVITET